MVQSNGSLVVAKTQRQAVAELAARGDPMRMLEAILNLGLGPEWICEQLKKIAENGGSMAQVKAVEAIASIFVESRAMTIGDILGGSKDNSTRGVHSAVQKALGVQRTELRVHDHDDGETDS